MVLIGVTIESAMFMEVNKPKPVILLEILKGMLTGKPADLGQVQRVTRAETRPQARRRRDQKQQRRHAEEHRGLNRGHLGPARRRSPSRPP